MLRDRTVSFSFFHKQYFIKAISQNRFNKILFLLAVCCCKSHYMYITETETPLSELKTFPNCKETYV